MRKIARKALEYRRDKGTIKFLKLSTKFGIKWIHDAIRHNRIASGGRQFHFYTKQRYRIQRRIFDAVADPYKHIWVNPNEIDYYNNRLKNEWGLGRIKWTNWDADKHCIPLSKKWVYEGIGERIKGKPWEETIYLQKVKEIYKNGGDKWGYESFSHFKEVRCEYLDEIIADIRTNGYKPNFEEASIEAPYKGSAKANSYTFRLEPLVVIGRDGELYLRDGWHRMSIVQHLHLDEEIPVQVMARHGKWQQIRSEFHNSTRFAELSERARKYVDHPDMNDIEGELKY